LGSVTKSTFDFNDDPNDPKHKPLMEYIYAFTVYLCAFIEIVMAMSISTTNMGAVYV
jgi:hypothetical protein